MVRRQGWVWMVVCVATVTLAGCAGAYRASDGTIQAVDPNSAVSVLGKLNDTNRDLGNAIGEHEWEQVAEEAQKLNKWATTAESLKGQSTNPESFGAACKKLAAQAMSIYKAAVAKDAKGASDGYAQTTQLLAALRKLMP